jgi:hypothetical protein
MRIDEYKVSSQYADMMGEFASMTEGKEMTCTGIDISGLSSSVISQNSQILEKCTGSFIDLLKNFSNYTSKPPVSSASVSACKNAALQCATELVTAPEATCNYCGTECVGAIVSTNPAYATAAEACRAGKSQAIASA